MTEPPTDSSAIGSGGWCAPGPLYALMGDHHIDDKIDLPTFTASRGGISFDQSPADLAASEALRALVSRVAARMAKQRDEVIGQACVVALANDWDVHVWPHHEHEWTHRRDANSYIITHRIGIEFRPAKYSVPTIVEHPPYDATFDDDEDYR